MGLGRYIGVLAVALALAPAGPAQAAVPGVNLPGHAIGDLDAAQALGARSVRLFVNPDILDANNRSRFQALARTAGERGIAVSFVLVNRAITDHDAATFANRAGSFAGAVKGLNQRTAYEIWNEEDSVEWWGAPVDAAAYVALLHATSAAIRDVDPAAAVVLGATTGNNYAWIEQLYGAGLRSASFDAAAVHTDTACLTSPPDSFYRDGGRLARFTFLGYREVLASMAAHGDAGKPIWMTELGWTSTGGSSGPLCTSGTWAGRKPAGVTLDQQAQFLEMAYHCLAQDPAVQHGMWFTLRDDPAQARVDLRHYGLLGKPAADAFKRVTAAPDFDPLPGRPCGDFDAPAITVEAPVDGQQFVGTLLIRASAADSGMGLARISFRADGAKDEIVNFTDGVADGKVVELDWQGAKRLPLGRHAIAVEAVDKNGNTSSRSIGVTKVRTLRATVASKVGSGKVRCKGRRCVLSGRVVAPDAFSIGGKVVAMWQRLTTGARQGKRTRTAWKTMHRFEKQASRPFRFSQRMAKPGRWRVQARYLGEAPLKASSSKFLYFAVR